MPACLRLSHNPLALLLTFLLLASGSAPDPAVAQMPTPSAGSPIMRSLPPSAAAACQSTISFGLTMECSVGSAGETDVFDFTAAANDKLKIRMTRTSGRLNPAVHVRSAAGETVCSAFTSDNSAEIGSCTVPEAGAYTLIAEDTYRTQTGSYNLYVQRLNNPGNAQPVNFGQTLSGGIDLVAEIDTYTFRAAAGSNVSVRTTRTVGDLRARIRIYDPDGTNICSAFSSGETTEIGRCDLDRANSYAILVDDTGSRTGSYTLYLECGSASCAFGAERLYLPWIATGQ